MSAVEARLAGEWQRCRVLHKPKADPDHDTPGQPGTGFACAGCVPNFNDWGIQYQDWPCATASIVYTPLEIAAALAGTPPEDER